MTTHRIIAGDCLEGLRTLPDASVHCCVTSPPYWGLRDYGHDGQIGLEETPEAYVARMVDVFREVRRVLRDDGTLWLNLGDSYAGSTMTGGNNGINSSGGDAGFKIKRQFDKPKQCGTLKPKDLVGIPWRVAFALQADGWWLRQDIIWHKPNPMPESVRDRCTKAHEYVFLLTKSERYFYDAEAVSEAAATAGQAGLGFYPQRAAAMGRKASGNEAKDPAEGIRGSTRNRRSVWTITTKPYSGAHFAVMPPDLVEPCIKAGTSEEGCCPACGTPWERVVERGHNPYPGSSHTHEHDAEMGGTQTHQSGLPAGTVMARRWHEKPPDRTTGWRPACTCGGSPVPCTVLDPFAGSGTTLAVALGLGRSGIGCELNPEYIRLAEQRIAEARAAAPLFT